MRSRNSCPESEGGVWSFLTIVPREHNLINTQLSVGCSDAPMCFNRFSGFQDVALATGAMRRMANILDEMCPLFRVRCQIAPLLLDRLKKNNTASPRRV